MMEKLEEKIYKILALELHPLNRTLTIEPSYYLFLTLNGEKNTIKNIGLNFTDFIGYMRASCGEKVAYLQDFIPELDNGKIKYFYNEQEYRIFYGTELESTYDWLQQFEIIYSELEQLFIEKLNISPMKFFLFALSLQDRTLNLLLENKEYLGSLLKEVELEQLYFPEDKTWFDSTKKALIFTEHEMKLILEGLKFNKEEQNLFFNGFVASARENNNFNIDTNTFIEKFYSNEVDSYWFIKSGNSYYLRPKNVSMVLMNNFARIIKKNFYTQEILNKVKNKIVFELAEKICKKISNVKVIINSEIKGENGIDYKSNLLLIIDEIHFVPISIVYPPKDHEVNLTEEVKKLRIISDVASPVVKGIDAVGGKWTEGEPQSKFLVSKENFFPIIIMPVMDLGRYVISSDEIDPNISFVSLDEFSGFIEEIDNGITLIKFLQQYSYLKEKTEIHPFSSFGNVFSIFKSYSNCLLFGGKAPDRFVVDPHSWSYYRYNSLCSKWASLIKFNSKEKPFVWKTIPLQNDLFFALVPNSDLEAIILVIKNEFYLWFMKNNRYLRNRDLLMNTFLIDMISYYFSKVEDFLYEHLAHYKCIHFYFYSVEVLNEHKNELKDLLVLIQQEDLNKPYTIAVNKLYTSLEIAFIFDTNKMVQLFDMSENSNRNEIEVTKKMLQSIGLTPGDYLFQQFVGKPRNVFKKMDFPVPLKEHLPPPVPLSKENLCFAEWLTFKACYESEFKPGKYYGEDAKAIISKIINCLESVLTDEIIKHKKTELLYDLIFESEKVEFEYLNTEMQTKMGVETYIEYDPVKAFSEALANEQRYAKVFAYLIELVLMNGAESSIQPSTLIEFSELIALGDELVTLYAILKNIHYGIWSNFGFEITEQYQINQAEEEPEGYRKNLIKTASKKLFGKDETLDSQEEKTVYLKKLDESFKKDLGFTFTDLMNVLEVLYEGIYDQENLYALQGFGSEEKLSKMIKENANHYEGLDINSINKVLEYLTLRKEDITEYIPTKISNDEHRFRIKPLIETSDKKIIFGRFSAHRTSIVWLYRISEGFFPYSIESARNYSTINFVINERKTFLDKKLEDLIYRSVSEAKKWDICKKDLDFHSYSSEKFSEDVGDFDVFCISIESKEILLVEAKNLRAAFVPSEISREYKSLFSDFKGDKRVDYASKFLRRIIFVKQNLGRILDNFKIITNECNWNIKSYFVMRNLSYNLFNIPKEFDEIEFLDLQDFLTLFDN